MTTALVIYASKHGHTSKIAGRIANRLRHGGASVDVHPVNSAEAVLLSKYDLVVVGPPCTPGTISARSSAGSPTTR